MPLSRGVDNPNDGRLKSSKTPPWFNLFFFLTPPSLSFSLSISHSASLSFSLSPLRFSPFSRIHTLSLPPFLPLSLTLSARFFPQRICDTRSASPWTRDIMSRSVRDTSARGYVERGGALASMGVNRSRLRSAGSTSTRMQDPVGRVLATSRSDGSIARKIGRDSGTSRRG